MCTAGAALDSEPAGVLRSARASHSRRLSPTRGPARTVHAGEPLRELAKRLRAPLVSLGGRWPR